MVNFKVMIRLEVSPMHRSLHQLMSTTPKRQSMCFVLLHLISGAFVVVGLAKY